MKLGEAIYKAQTSEGTGAGDDEEPRGVDEDIVDAEYEDLDDDRKRKSS
jgi:molecular chaperone DnaK